MKRNTFFLILILSVMLSAQIKAQAYIAKQHVLTAGYGIPDFNKILYYQKSLSYKVYSPYNYYNNGYYASEIYSNAHIKSYGPIFLKYEYGLTDLISAGLVLVSNNETIDEELNASTQTYSSTGSTYVIAKYQNEVEERFTGTSLGARVNFHFSTSERTDVYAGVAGGYAYEKYDVTYKAIGSSKLYHANTHKKTDALYFGITAGLRYYFSESAGIYGEIGIDKFSLIQLGAVIKF